VSGQVTCKFQGTPYGGGGAAQHLLIKGYDIAAIMRAGGCSNAEMVSRYLQFSHHNIWQWQQPGRPKLILPLALLSTQLKAYHKKAKYFFAVGP